MPDRDVVWRCCRGSLQALVAATLLELACTPLHGQERLDLEVRWFLSHTGLNTGGDWRYAFGGGGGIGIHQGPGRGETDARVSLHLETATEIGEPAEHATGHKQVRREWQLRAQVTRRVTPTSWFEWYVGGGALFSDFDLRGRGEREGLAPGLVLGLYRQDSRAGVRGFLEVPVRIGGTNDVAAGIRAGVSILARPLAVRSGSDQ